MSNFHDIECPYCGKGLDVNHDDGRGYEENEFHEQICSACKKTFVFETTITFHYDAFKADCLNGGDHVFEKMKLIPADMYSDAKRCKQCGMENLGKYVEPKTIAVARCLSP